MSRESGQDRSQKTVAELLALHGGNVEGRRRHRRAADEEDEQNPAPPRRARGTTDTGPQAIIDRVRGDGGPPQAGRRRAMPADEAPNGSSQDSGYAARPNGAVPRPPNGAPNGAEHANGAQPSGAFPRPPQQQSGAFPRPPQESGAFPQPEGTGFARAPQQPGDASGYARPPQQPDASGYSRGPQPEANGYSRASQPGAADASGYARAPQESGGFPQPSGAGDASGFSRAPQQPDANGFAPQQSGAFPQQPGTADASGYSRAPQESGAFPRPNGAPDASGFARPPQESGAFPRPPQESGAFSRPGGTPPPANALPTRRPKLPDPAEEPARAEETRQVPPLRPAQPGGLAARLDGLDANEQAPEQPPGPMASGAFPAPPVQPRRPRRAPARRPAEPEPHTEQFEAVGEQAPAEPVVAPDAPPAGLSRWRRQRQQASSEDTEVGVMPVMRDPHPSGFAPAPEAEDALEATGFHDPFADDDEDVDEFGDFGEAEPERLGGYDYEPKAEPAEDDEPEEAASPAKQWLSMAVQLALGVIGGAAVWLGFNWLWGQIPAAALVAALVVIVGLVLIVRKIRRADDLQTMVLAVLVGLVVTVSPAALLLLSR